MLGTILRPSPSSENPRPRQLHAGDQAVGRAKIDPNNLRGATLAEIYLKCPHSLRVDWIERALHVANQIFHVAAAIQRAANFM
jgi:hypothetical protein